MMKYLNTNIETFEDHCNWAFGTPMHEISGKKTNAEVHWNSHSYVSTFLFNLFLTLLIVVFQV